MELICISAKLNINKINYYIYTWYVFITYSSKIEPVKMVTVINISLTMIRREKER